MADQQLFFINLQGAGIIGECQQPGHQGWMAAQSWNFSMTQSADHCLGAGGGGTAAFGSFSFDRIHDKTSPRLLAHCSQGTHIPQVQFEAERQATQQADAQVYFSLVFRDVVISGRSVSHYEGEHGRETITFAFREVEMTHRQVAADGTVKAGVTRRYDAKTNKAS